MKKIQIINGPNLNLLGRREPGVYGATSFDKCLAESRGRYSYVQVDFDQSYREGAVINILTVWGFEP